MRMSSIIFVFIFLIEVIGTKPVTYIDQEDYFKEYPIESSTEKNFFRAPAWTGGCMMFVFKVFNPHPEFKLEFKLTDIGENSTDDDIVNSQKWSLTRSYSDKYSTDDYDIFYYWQNYPIGYKGHVGIFFTSDNKFKMNFLIQANGYYFPISSVEEKIVEDYTCTHYFKTTVEGEGLKDMSLVMRVYKPMETYDFSLSGLGYYETAEKKPQKLNLGSYKIKEGNNYI